MGATAERPVSVNQTATGRAPEQRADAVVSFRQGLPAGGADALGGGERLAFRELRRETGELKLATFRAGVAGAFHRSAGQFRINRPDFRQNRLKLIPLHPSKKLDDFLPKLRPAIQRKMPAVRQFPNRIRCFERIKIRITITILPKMLPTGGGYYWFTCTTVAGGKPLK